MHRPRRHSIETVLGLVLVVLALLAGLGVLVHEGVTGDDSVLATRSADTPATPTTTAVEPDGEPTRPTGSSPDEQPGAGSGSTTTTMPAPTTSTTVAPSEPELAACPDLESETVWSETADREPLTAAAGSLASYVEVVTNRSDQPCRLEANRCGTTAELRTVEGQVTDAPDLACTAESREVVLPPGGELREELTVRFPVPPGEYRAHVRGYDGVEVVLPVVLDDRLPACDPTGLELAAGAEQRVAEGDARERGFALPLVVTGADEGCTVRAVETQLALAGDNRLIDLVDPTVRWSTATAADRVETRAVAPPTDLAPGWYDVTVTVALADGTRLRAPSRILVG